MRPDVFLPAELEHIEQDERVYMSQAGDLFFAHVEDKDSRSDYCCFAAFPRLRTIVQKMPMKLTVRSCKSCGDAGCSRASGSARGQTSWEPGGPRPPVFGSAADGPSPSWQMSHLRSVISCDVHRLVVCGQNPPCSRVFQTGYAPVHCGFLINLQVER